MIPQQRTESTPGTTPCVHCGGAIHLVNRQLGPTWVHLRGDYTYCLITTAEPMPIGVSR